MSILLGIIILHIGAIFSARKFKKIDIGAAFLLALLSLMITVWILYGMFTMEQPDTTDRFY